MNDKISVIIPFYNGKEWLEEALGSVLSQTLEPYEIIIVNDGAIENIDDLVEKYQDKIIYIKQENRGAANARNNGIKHSSGDYIAFLDSDDLWLPDKLKIQLNYMKEKNINWSHGPYKVFDDKSHIILKEIDNRKVDGMIFPRSLARCCIATPCVMIKKECLNDKRMEFNEKMRQGQDYCFWNVLAKNYEIGNVGKSLALVRKHTDNKANNVIAQIKSKSQMYDYIKENYSYFGKIPIVLLTAFILSHIGYHCISKVDNSMIRIILSYVLYALPWGLFRVYYLLERK